MPRLTEQEQQEIVRYIEAGRELPEKYRFLLFENKREIIRVPVNPPTPFPKGGAKAALKKSGRAITFLRTSGRASGQRKTVRWN